MARRKARQTLKQRRSLAAKKGWATRRAQMPKRLMLVQSEQKGIAEEADKRDDAAELERFTYKATIVDTPLIATEMLARAIANPTRPPMSGSTLPPPPNPLDREMDSGVRYSTAPLKRERGFWDGLVDPLVEATKRWLRLR